MNLIRYPNQANKTKPCALTIGNFDGVHLGHKKIITKVKQIAQEENIISAILTFEPHPISLFKPELRDNFRINSLAQKLKIFKDLAIDNVMIAPFNQEFSNLSAHDFIKKILVEQLNVKHLIIGYDFIFGKNREGNLSLLQDAAKHFGFNVINVLAQKNGEQIYSSSLIRNFIKQGKIVDANNLLGHNFTICGTISEGKKLARTIGFPTANLKPKPHIIKPKFGVYQTLIHLDNKIKNGIMNFGLKPTIGNALEPLYEIHIFDFNQEIYGKKINVELLNFIREEKKFDSLDSLKKQIEIDIKSHK